MFSCFYCSFVSFSSSYASVSTVVSVWKMHNTILVNIYNSSYLFLVQLTCSAGSCVASLLYNCLSRDPLSSPLLISCLSFFGNGCVSSSGGTSTTLVTSLCHIHHNITCLTCLCFYDDHCHIFYTCTSLLFPLVHTQCTRGLFSILKRNARRSVHV